MSEMSRTNTSRSRRRGGVIRTRDTAPEGNTVGQDLNSVFTSFSLIVWSFARGLRYVLSTGVWRSQQ